MFEQKSVQNRYKRIQGFHNMFDEQKTLVVTESAMDHEVKQRMFYEGDNPSSNIYPIVLDDYESIRMWCATPQVKSKIFTSDNIVGMGSGTYVCADDSDNVKKAAGEEEPVFFHNLPVKLAREYIHCYPCDRVIDCTGADGAWALASMKARKVCLVICFSDVHEELLKIVIVHQAFMDMQDSDDPTYEAVLVTGLDLFTKTSS